MPRRTSTSRRFAPSSASGSDSTTLGARRIDPAESCLREALAEARRAGDVILELRCLTYLTVARRLERDARGVSGLADEALRLAEAAGALEYVGAAESNLAWAAWQDGRAEEAVRRAEAALSCWAAPGLVWPFQWLALWPLIAAAVDRDDVTGPCCMPGSSSPCPRSSA